MTINMWSSIFRYIYLVNISEKAYSSIYIVHIVLFMTKTMIPGMQIDEQSRWRYWSLESSLFDSIWVLEPQPLPAPSKNRYLYGHINIWLPNLKIRKEWRELLHSYIFAAARHDQLSPLNISLNWTAFEWWDRKLGVENLWVPLRHFDQTPSFPFCTILKTENSELKTSELSLRHYDQTRRQTP